jgi:ADP-heptose:LPS heptosyltransferase
MIRLNALGDVVLTTGVLDHWHRSQGLSFRVITRSVFAPLFENNPAVEETLAIAENGLIGMRWFRNAWQIARRFSHCRLVDLHGTFRSAVLSILWRGPVAHYPKFTIERRRFLKTRSRDAQMRLLEANVPQRYAMALEDSPPAAEEVRPRIILDDTERDIAYSILRRNDLERPFAVLHPYAVHAAKMWQESSWKTLGKLLNDNGCDWVVIGRSGNLFMKQIAGSRDFTNATDLRTTCAILSHAAVLVSADSGPIHLAAAVGTPVVALFGPTSREWGFYPFGPEDRVMEQALSCRPCSLHGEKECACQRECLKSISPENVLGKILQM